MVYQSRNPLGYKNLLTWKQAGEIYHQTKNFTRSYLVQEKDRRLIGHLDDSARSVQRNIEEGFKRTTTKEYVAFLGFSRASLEELKGDFEELKREWNEEIRWADKGQIRDDKGKIGEKEMREEIIEKIEGLLNLIYGEDCMVGRQMASLEKKMVKEKTLPQQEMIKKSWQRGEAQDKKFWRLAKERFGIKRDEKGLIKRIIGENKGE